MMCRIYIVALLLLCSGSVQSASYDCGLSSLSDIEIEICSSSELAALDEYLSDAYTELKQQLDEVDKKHLLSTQRKWLKTRNSCLKEAFPRSCISDQYSIRSQILNSWRSLLDGERLASCQSRADSKTYFSCLLRFTRFDSERKVISRLGGFDYGLEASYTSLDTYIADSCLWPIQSKNDIYDSVACYISSADDISNAVPKLIFESSKEGTFSKIFKLDDFSDPVADESVRQRVTGLIQSGSYYYTNCEGQKPDFSFIRHISKGVFGTPNLYIADYQCNNTSSISILEVNDQFSEVLGSQQYLNCYRYCEGVEVGVSTYLNDMNGDGIAEFLFFSNENDHGLWGVLGRSSDNKYFSHFGRDLKIFPGESESYRESRVSLSEYRAAREKTVWPFHAISANPEKKHVVYTKNSLTSENYNFQPRVISVKERIYSHAIIQDTKLVVQAVNGQLKITDIESNQVKVIPTNYMFNYFLHDNGKYLAYTVKRDGLITYWIHDILNDQTIKIPRSMTVRSESSRSPQVAVSASGKQAVFEWNDSNSRYIFYYDSRTNTVTPVVEGEWVFGANISNSGDYVAYCEKGKTKGIFIWERETGESALVIPYPELPNLSVCDAEQYVLSSDGRSVIYANGPSDGADRHPLIGGLDFSVSTGPFASLEGYDFLSEKVKLYQNDLVLHRVTNSSQEHAVLLVNWVDPTKPVIVKSWNEISLSINLNDGVFTNGYQVIDESGPEAWRYPLNFHSDAPSTDIRWDSFVSNELVTAANHQSNAGNWLVNQFRTYSPEFELGKDSLHIKGEGYQQSLPFIPLGEWNASTECWDYSPEARNAAIYKQMADRFPSLLSEADTCLNISKDIAWEISLYLAGAYDNGYVLNLYDNERNSYWFGLLKEK
ncbi:lysozyme inhibitor LprI family protein [Reinekea marinisedimentorum]|uniref:Uncharacterized protein YecT (DUF1311 family) n=1 Tax=Reinekea marinisedimentorum TaxID=230495 RepID=A0A4R3HR07_9GAMM|nr:lysozyme inhibitor LprI family protein [Reinekea marinisedimentorum]TCS35527.1 uncharacterized protein YecT (DUF1311 family) [Reinekea marinisedimentorum]